MDHSLISLALGLTAALGFGTGDFLIGKTSRKITPLVSSLLVNFYSFIVYGLLVLVFMRGHLVFTPTGVQQALLAGIFMGIAQAVFFKAISLGPVGLVSSIASTYPLITLIAGGIFVGLAVSAVQALGITLIVGGVMVASGVFGKQEARRRIGKGPLLAIVPALGWGLSWVFVYKAMEHMDWGAVFMVELLVTPFVISLLVPFIRGKERVSPRLLKKHWKISEVWVVAVLQMLGLLSINAGIGAFPENTAMIVVLSSCYPILTIFLALRHLDEHIPFVPLCGGVLGVIGVAILSLSGS